MAVNTKFDCSREDANIRMLSENMGLFSQSWRDEMEFSVQANSRASVAGRYKLQARI